MLSDEAKARINSIGAVGISDDGSCSITDCLGDKSEDNAFCRLTAVCKKLVGYALRTCICVL